MYWKDAYTPPFKDCYGICIKDSKGRMVANFLTTSEENRSRIIGILNGKLKSEALVPFSRQNQHIYYGPHKILLMRGWGYLTGIGGLNLDEETAAQIKDSMADYIVDKLNNKK